MPAGTSLKLYNDLDAIERDAGRLLDRSSQPGMFDRLDWFKLAAHYTLDGDPLVVNANNGSASSWLFLDRKGSYAAALSNWYCLRFRPVTHGREGAQPPIAELAEGLRKAGVSHLFVDRLSEDDPLPAALRRKGWLVRHEQVNVSWRIDTKDMDFADYWATRPSRLRNSAKRKARKAGLRFAFFDRFDDKAWIDLEQVFDASWKLPEGSPELIRDIVVKEGEAGTLRLGLAYKDDLAVAAQIWIIEHGIATIHKLAYREDVKELSAGTILSVEMFRRALEIDKVDKIDFGIGNDTYKREWMTHSVPMYALSAYYPYSWSGLAGLAKAASRKILRRFGMFRDEVDAHAAPRR